MDDVGQKVRQGRLAEGAAAADEDEEPEVEVAHGLRDLLVVHLGLGGVVGARAALHDVALLGLAEAPGEGARAAGQAEQDDEGEGHRHDALDQEDPLPRPPPVGPVQIHRDRVRDQPVEGPCERRH